MQRITTGNNGGKFLFEVGGVYLWLHPMIACELQATTLQVEYELPDECLHTKLFAKIPHGMEKAILVINLRKPDSRTTPGTLSLR